jgi:hypothetical protein
MEFETEGAEMLKELDTRISNEIEVSLLWSSADNRVLVRVYDASTEEELELEVDPAHALDAFHHPYAYAARRRVLDPVYA